LRSLLRGAQSTARPIRSRSSSTSIRSDSWVTISPRTAIWPSRTSLDGGVSGSGWIERKARIASQACRAANTADMHLSLCTVTGSRGWRGDICHRTRAI
jgi:hypothetical protein